MTAPSIRVSVRLTVVAGLICASMTLAQAAAIPFQPSNQKPVTVTSVAAPSAPVAGSSPDCYDAAGVYHQVNPTILRAIAWVETHNHPDAQHLNANGSVDTGLMQINSVHLTDLARYGISVQTLQQGCSNVFIAGWLLHQKMMRYGNTWRAVGAYHSETSTFSEHYAIQVQDTLRVWHLWNGARGFSADQNVSTQP